MVLFPAYEDLIHITRPPFYSPPHSGGEAFVMGGFPPAKRGGGVCYSPPHSGGEVFVMCGAGVHACEVSSCYSPPLLFPPAKRGGGVCYSPRIAGGRRLLFPPAQRGGGVCYELISKDIASFNFLILPSPSMLYPMDGKVSASSLCLTEEHHVERLHHQYNRTYTTP